MDGYGAPEGVETVRLLPALPVRDRGAAVPVGKGKGVPLRVAGPVFRELLRLLRGGSIISDAHCLPVGGGCLCKEAVRAVGVITYGPVQVNDLLHMVARIVEGYLLAGRPGDLLQVVEPAGRVGVVSERGCPARAVRHLRDPGTGISDRKGVGAGVLHLDELPGSVKDEPVPLFVLYLLVKRTFAFRFATCS